MRRQLLTIAVVFTALIVFKRMDSPPYAFIGTLPIAGVFWLLYLYKKGRTNGNKYALGALIFWFLSTGSWFYLIAFSSLNKYHLLAFLIVTQGLSFLWLIPVIIYHKLKLKRSIKRPSV